MQIRKATSEDSHDIWSWRNDPVSRAMSKNTDEVPWESHARWYDSALANPRRFLFVGYDENQRKIGMCRLDVVAEGVAEVSINLSPQMRGRGLSSPLLAAAIQAFWVEKAGTLIKATVRNQNPASLRCFEKCGFVLQSREGDFNHYELAAT